MSSSSSRSPREVCSEKTKTMLNALSYIFKGYYILIIEPRYVSVLKTVFTLTDKALLNVSVQIN